MRLNLDETSVAMFSKGMRGNIVFGKKQLRKVLRPCTRVRKELLRNNFTHVAIITDLPWLQPLLPQVLLFNPKQISKRRLRALAPTLPPNVYARVSTSAWSSKVVHRTIIRLLGDVLAAFTDEYQPVLLLDAVKLHLDRAVLDLAFEMGIWTCVVPTACTWLLQPLDTHVFARYKQVLKGLVNDVLTDEGGVVSAETVTPSLCTTIRTVLQANRWRSAFMETGFGASQQCLSAFVLEHVDGVRSPVLVPAVLPTEEMLKAILPRGWAVEARTFLRPWLMGPPPLPPPAAPPPPLAGSSSGPAAGTEDVPPPLRLRLRRKTSAAHVGEGDSVS